MKNRIRVRAWYRDHHILLNSGFLTQRRGEEEDKTNLAPLNLDDTFDLRELTEIGGTYPRRSFANFDIFLPLILGIYRNARKATVYLSPPFFLTRLTVTLEEGAKRGRNFGIDVRAGGTDR